MNSRNKEVQSCVLIDTNIWRDTLFLRGGLGPALMHLVNRVGLKLALPEVIEGEITKHIYKLAEKACKEIERSFRELGAILGSHRPYEIPKNEEIEAAIKKRFDELSPFIVRISFTLDHAKKALFRVNEKLPPSSLKTQQFKDAAIWEAALELGKTMEILLITQDGDFFEDKDRKALNQILRKECEQLDISLRIFSDLGTFLRELRDEVPDLDYEKITQSIYRSISDRLAKHAAKNGLRVTGIRKPRTSAFITENHDLLALEYEIVFDAIDIGSDVTESKHGCVWHRIVEMILNPRRHPLNTEKPIFDNLELCAI